jgi:multiple sugar transport system permease protein
MPVKGSIKLKRGGKVQKDYTAYLMIAPFFLAFLAFGFYPLFNTFYLSVTNATLMNKTYKFNGIDNYISVWRDKFFLQSVLNTWKIWLMNFIPQVGIAMLLAVWMTNTRLKIRLIGFWRAIFYLPNLLMPATVAAFFGSLFDLYSPVNSLLVGQLHIVSKAIDFQISEPFMQGLVAYIQWWMWFGNTLIILIAGMSSISESLYEAAMVDGANTATIFRRITLPILRPVLVYTLITSLVGGMQMLDIPYMITDQRGSPNGSLQTLMVYLYLKYKASKGPIGIASAVGVYIFIITGIVAIIVFFLLRDKDEIAMQKERKRFQKQRAMQAKGGAAR